MTGADLGTPLAGRRIRTRATHPPVDPRLLRFDPTVRRFLVTNGLLAAVTAAALIAQATALAAIIARTFLDGAGLTDHRGWLLLLLTAVIVRAAATWTIEVLAQRTSARVKAGLRSAVIDRVTRRAPGEGEGSTGELAGALTDGVDALDGTFGGYLPALTAGVVVPVTIVGWLVWVDPSSAVVLAVTLPLIPLFMVLIGLAARAATRRRFRALTSLSGQLLAVLQGMTTIRVARATGRVRERVRDAGERLRITTLETLRIAFLSALTLELLAALAVATVAVIAGVRLAEGTGVGFEPVLVALLLAPEAFLPLRRVGQQFHANEDGAAAAERLFDLLEAPTHQIDGGEQIVPELVDRPIRFAAVSVCHPGREFPALDQVELTFEPGELVAVVGATGSGKTTLGNILLGLRRPDGGRVLIGDVDLADLDPDAWHARVAWVPQDPADIAGTVRDVVTLGHPDGLGSGVPDRSVWEALASVRLDAEVAALPQGLDTPIGPGGRGMSTGQRRRLAVARALLRSAELLVLDEPTGDLDVEAEEAVRELLVAQRGRRTVVVLTHRIALAAAADRVVVLDRGRVVEGGSPATLLGRDGPYAALVRATQGLTLDEVRVGATQPLSRDEARSTQPERPDPAAVGRPHHPATDRREEPGRTLPTVRSMLTPYRRPLVVAVVAGAITPLSGVLLVAVSTYLISRAALQPNLLDLTVVIVLVRALSLLKGTSRYVERLAGHDVALRTVADLRVYAYERLVPRIPTGLGPYRLGDVLARVVADVERLQLALVRGVVPLLGGLLASATIVLLGGWLLRPAGAVLALGLSFATVGIPLVATQLAERPERALAQARGRLAAELVELLQAAPELRLLGRLGPMRHHLDVLDAEVARRDGSAVARGGGADALVQLTLGLSAIGLVIIGVPAVNDGTIDGVMLGALVVLALAAVEAVGPLPASAKALVTARVAARRLRQVLEAPLPVPDPATTTVGEQALAPVAAPASRLVLDEVTARYPGAPRPAVEELVLQLAPGRRVAVVGRSGAGKSTLANLTVRFLDPVRGEVRLDEIPFTRMRGDEIRRSVVLAPQDGHVFDGTIATNLRLAAPEAADETLWKALAAAQLDAWVAELPDGLETTVGERGNRMSGGQRHRLALARTLLSAAPLIVIDEPTADLDAVTGRAFLRDTLAASEGRGVLLLTHDLRALPVVDEVVVIEDGRVVSRGRHDALLAHDPAYAARWRLDVQVAGASGSPAAIHADEGRCDPGQLTASPSSTTPNSVKSDGRWRPPGARRQVGSCTAVPRRGDPR